LDDAAATLPHLDLGDKKKQTISLNDTSTAQEQLKKKGFIAKLWFGKCEADKVSMGVYPVPPGDGGMYGLVFDNTFSKQNSKTATFVLLTYPSNAPPHSSHHLQTAPAMSAAIGKSPKISASASGSVDSLHSHLGTGPSGSRGNSVMGRGDGDIDATYHVGVLSKRRRKRGQGYARRFFSLDFASCTLSYYYSRNSSALRGAIPLSLAAIAADERRREISIDSGAEIWHLKAGNAKDFDDWTKALEKASNTARAVIPEVAPAPRALTRVKTTGLQVAAPNHDEELEWEQVESLVSRIVGTRDAVRRLSKDTAPGPNKKPSLMGLGLSTGSSPAVEEGGDYFATPPERRPFWRRKSSAPSTTQAFQRAISSQLAVPSPATSTTVSATGVPSPSRKNRHSAGRDGSSMHEHCTALLNDLDAVLLDFSAVLANSKRRRLQAPALQHSATRTSMDSTATAEFYDAESGDVNESQVLMIDRHSGDETQPSEADDDFVDDASSISSAEDEDSTAHLHGTAALFPIKPKTLDPLPISSAIKRRTTVPPATVMPPSLIGFLRKNVGKDLSTISMPVSANEPTSLLQRTAEQLEYTQLLDEAASYKTPAQRLIQVTAFAISSFSINRARERAIRKPFNPMLGETFEIVRSDKDIPGGFRFLAEKVSHRPVRIAFQADSANWSLSQSPAPDQKFWGKSAELITNGRVRLVLRLADGTDELYSWNCATGFLRNIVMGEKYVEPVGTMTIANETTGGKATVEFKQKGMFGGRSEDVQVETYGPDGAHDSLGLIGTWTTSLRVSEAGKPGAEIWHAGDLVNNAANCYGMTTFAATLNEITELEKGKIAPTDSRLRPDQRAAENGDLDSAEQWKTTLEENQRIRRKDMETKGETYKPRWFAKVEGGDEGEEVWKLRGGKEGYWEERMKGSWAGVEDILAI
jgi:hypothetical protein